MGQKDHRSLGSCSRNLGRKTVPMCLSVGKHWGDGVTERAVWHVVKEYARKLGLAQVAPHDLRVRARSCAMRREENWIRFNSFSATFPCRQLNAISAASSE